MILILVVEAIAMLAVSPVLTEIMWDHCNKCLSNIDEKVVGDREKKREREREREREGGGDRDSRGCGEGGQIERQS